MKSVVVCNLSDEVYRAIRQRADSHGRSTEAEIRAILTEAVQLADRVKLGTLLFGVISEEARLTDAERETYFGRDKTPAEPVEFDR